jgi:hypothetical protein
VEGVNKLLVGNKSDLATKKVVDYAAAKVCLLRILVMESEGGWECWACAAALGPS